MTDPLPHDVNVVGPITLTLHAAIDQDDTNWIIVLRDVGPTCRFGPRARANAMCRRRCPSVN